MTPRGGDRLGVARVGVADDAETGVAGEDALQLFVRLAGPVRDNHHSRVQRVADADPAAVVDRYPRRARGRGVVGGAFGPGQSAMASLPSRILSVSRLGEATEPASRWSRPMTIGAVMTPWRTRSLIARPKRARSPYPSQKMRAGRS